MLKTRKRWILLPTTIVALAVSLALAWTFMGFSPILPFPSIYSISLDVDPVEDQPRTFQFIARITGGVDFVPGLYCRSTKWDLGGGRIVTQLPLCRSWWSGGRMPRVLQYTHTYEGPGTYQATVSYGWLDSEPVTVQVE